MFNTENLLNYFLYSEDLVTKVYQSQPEANIDDWIEAVKSHDENFRSFMMTGHQDHKYFDIDVVMQVCEG